MDKVSGVHPVSTTPCHATNRATSTHRKKPTNTHTHTHAHTHTQTKTKTQKRRMVCTFVGVLIRAGPVSNRHRDGGVAQQVAKEHVLHHLQNESRVRLAALACLLGQRRCSSAQRGRDHHVHLLLAHNTTSTTWPRRQQQPPPTHALLSLSLSLHAPPQRTSCSPLGTTTPSSGWQPTTPHPTRLDQCPTARVCWVPVADRDLRGCHGSSATLGCGRTRQKC